ncbi:uncharacterized protein [Antedon mediterranea]|uniref:uncharacterized protein n=1 Tax=Antedon mediterranea TaxID=105859 RepID=UPI003AF5A029
MYVLRVFSIFVIFIAVEGTNCGDTYTGTYGEISSPLYPENYPGNTTCMWKITVPEESRVSVKFRSFDFYCPHDYLEIYLDGTGDEVHDRLCGSNYYTLLSEANSMLLMFVSDSNLSGKGFHLIWRAVELVSRGKPTKQSSVLVVAGDPRGSDLAVDGDPNPFFNSGSCTHTHNDFEPWWTVDLEKAYAVQFVDIVNRESAAERLTNAVVHIGMNPTPHSVNPRCGSTVSAESILLSTNIRVECNELMYGRYVSVCVVGRNEYLTLCEVEVFGINLISSPETTVDCSYSPGPCDIPATDCSIPNFEWPSCSKYLLLVSWL